MDNIATWEGWNRLAALAAVATLFYTTQSLVVTQKQVDLSHRSQVYDQYKNSISQIESSSIIARTAGISTLIEVAHVTPGEDSAIREILVEFVLINAPKECNLRPISRDLKLAVSEVTKEKFPSTFELQSICISDTSADYRKDALLLARPKCLDEISSKAGKSAPTEMDYCSSSFRSELAAAPLVVWTKIGDTFYPHFALTLQ